MTKERKVVEKLGAVLFRRIERAQGMAFVSDGETFKTRAEFFERIRGRLRWQRKGSRIMEEFLRQNGELRPK